MSAHKPWHYPIDLPNLSKWPSYVVFLNDLSNRRVAAILLWLQFTLAVLLLTIVPAVNFFCVCDFVCFSVQRLFCIPLMVLALMCNFMKDEAFCTNSRGVCAQLVSCDRPGHSLKLAIRGDCNASHLTRLKFFFFFFFSSFFLKRWCSRGH